VVAIQGPGIETLEDADRRTLELLARQAALTLERLALTEERERTEVAMEAERLRGTLLSSISHDLRTPLASIEGAGTALLEVPADAGADDRRELLETIVEESRRMTRMVTNLLDMVRVESGALTMHRAWIPVEEVIGVARLRLDPLLADRAVQVELPTDPLLVFADEILLEQVLVNLLENAVRYTPPRSPIQIAAFTSGPEVIVEVADRGPGVPEGERETVFRKFYRVAPGGRTGGLTAGTGLGLAICRGVISAHGGRIWVEPHEGGGASFRFALPRETPPASPEEGE
jgi:two-component system sensor histidine kinase KdpD